MKLRWLLLGVFLVLVACSVPTPEPTQATPAAAEATIAALQSQLDLVSTQLADNATQIAIQSEHISYLATRVPVRLPTTAPVSPTPYRPVVGSVLIEQGFCCAGGIAGDMINLSVAIEAESPLAEVVEMRYRLGTSALNEEEMGQATWELFTESIEIPIIVANNWVGFYVSVQFRDALGNLSQVLSDDISVEGMPPSPTP